MSFPQVIKYLFSDTRARVYLLWGVLTGIGFTLTHYFQLQVINIVWSILSAIGLGYMYKVMPMRIRQMKNIFYSWLVPICVGMIVSILIFHIDSLARFSRDLGIFWLIMMALGYFFNGLADSEPRYVYWGAVVLNIGIAFCCLVFPSFRDVQYLLAAIVSVWSMTGLLLLRSFDS